MNVSDLIVEVRDVNLRRVAQLTDADLTTLIAVPRPSDVGSWEIKLPDRVLSPEGVFVAHAAATHLRQEGAGLIVTGPDGVILSGPMLSATYESSRDDLSGTWAFTGVSDEVILADALAFPSPEVADPNKQTRANDTRTARAEDLLRAYVEANIGALAPAERRTGFRSRLDLGGPSQGLGLELTKSPRFTNLLELLREIASAAGLLFSVVQSGDRLVFSVREPADRTAFVRMDVQNGLLASVAFGFGSPTATRAIVAGQGEGTERSLVARASTSSVAAESAWGRRIERFLDQRQAAKTAELEQAGDALLAAGGATVQGVQATPSDDLAMTYLRDWRVGDRVAVVVGDKEPAAIVTEVAMRVSGAAVVFAVTLGDPSTVDPDARSEARAAHTSQRVSALERNAEASNAGQEWASKGGPTGAAIGYGNTWAKGVDSGGSIDATSDPLRIKITADGVYEVTAYQRGTGDPARAFIGIALDGDRFALENRAGGMWFHDHSASLDSASTSRYLGPLAAGEAITAGPPADATTGLRYGSSSHLGALFVRRVS